jgi:hypothetical protein
MIALAAFALLVQAAPVAPSRDARIPVQLGVSVSADTVTVGERFVVVVRVRAPRSATIDFPAAVDSAAANSVTGMEMVEKPAVATLPDSTSLTMSAAYRLAAWDVGLQRFALPDIVVRYNGVTGYVSLADRGVFVRSVLPQDSALRVPKPPRPQIEIKGFDWRQYLIALAVLAVTMGLWRLWIWYRRRRAAPLDPYDEAQREFARIEAMRLIEAGEPERHAALMSDAMRDYLARRVPEIERSHTSSELVGASGRIHSVASGLGELLWRTDLIKFARNGVSSEESEKLGASARAVVEAVEEHIAAEEEQRKQEQAA